MTHPLRASLPLVCTLMLCSTAYAGKKKTPPPSPPEGYRDIAAELVGKAMVSDLAYDRLVELCDGIGHRLSGSPTLDEAIRWAERTMQQDGLDTRTEPVTVPRWVRGTEQLTMTAPRPQTLELLTLGMSVGTPPEGIEAPVVVIDSFEHLDRLGKQIEGHIVLYDVPFTTYYENVQYRTRGPSRAASYGAVAVLVRSVTPTSLSTPHTGTL